MGKLQIRCLSAKCVFTLHFLGNGSTLVAFPGFKVSLLLFFLGYLYGKFSSFVGMHDFERFFSVGFLEDCQMVITPGGYEVYTIQCVVFNMFERVAAGRNSYMLSMHTHTKSRSNDIIMKINGTTDWGDIWEQDYCLASSVIQHAVV